MRTLESARGCRTSSPGAERAGSRQNRTRWVADHELIPPLTNDCLEHVPELAGSLLNALPVYAVDAEDVANAVAWPDSDEARYITGTVLPVDAGNVNRR